MGRLDRRGTGQDEEKTRQEGKKDRHRRPSRAGPEQGIRSEAGGSVSSSISAGP